MVLVKDIENLSLREKLMNAVISLACEKNAIPAVLEVIKAADCTQDEVFARYVNIDIETLAFDTVDFIAHRLLAKLTEFNVQIKSLDTDNPLVLSKAFLAFDNLVYQSFVSNAGRALLVIYAQYKNEYRLKHYLSHVKNAIISESERIMCQLTTVHNAEIYISRYFDAPIYADTSYLFLSSQTNNNNELTLSAKDN